MLRNPVSLIACSIVLAVSQAAQGQCSASRVAVTNPSDGGWLRIFDANTGSELVAVQLGYPPAGIAEGRDGSLLVLRQNDGPIFRYDRETGALLGTLMEENAAGVIQGRDIEFMPTGDMLIAGGSANRIPRIDGLSGRFEGNFVGVGVGGLDRPFGFTYRGNGNLVVASYDSASVLEYDGTTGAFIRELVPPGLGGLATPYNLVYTSDDDALVVDRDSGRVLRYDGSSGAYLGDFTDTLLPSARGIAFGPSGNLFVCSWQGPQGGGVYEFDGETGVLTRQLASSPGAMFMVFYNFCRADLTGSSNPNDLSFGVPDCDADDFFYSLDLFAAGC